MMDANQTASGPKAGGPVGFADGGRAARSAEAPVQWDYAPAPESTKPAIREEYGLFVNGEWCSPKSGRYFETINPANEQPLARVAHAGEEDVERAVRAARKAYEK